MPDARSPAIVDELQSLSRLLPGPSAFLGAEATASRLFEHAASSRYIHIAAHGEFRSDNPMFSSIRLADGPINALDLYRLSLQAELVALSGCSTGAGKILSGDELVGLARGLMHAGARAVLLTLWEIHDPSTAAFMDDFYAHLLRGNTPSAALRHAMLTLREKFPEPYYWAPFMLSGYALRPAS
jgi:CHAT domain-containing protein